MKPIREYHDEYRARRKMIKPTKGFIEIGYDKIDYDNTEQGMSLPIVKGILALKHDGNDSITITK